VSLTVGNGPFGHRPAGVFNIEVPRERLFYFEASPRRIRGIADGETVVDSRHVHVLHEHGRLPLYCFPRADVRTDLLVASDRRERSPVTGEAAYFGLRRGERVVDDAAWEYAEGPLAGHVAFAWDALDRWLEEDEEALGHARDPYHRVDAVPSSRHVRISLDGEMLAESTRAVAIFETGLAARWYLPREDVRAPLEPSELQTTCAYKGHARYWSVRTSHGLEENLAWTYEEPRHDAAAVAGRVAFFDERVEVELDGEHQPRPQTPWSRPGWWRDRSPLRR
jgi:uncharacterized protein (DUF427 family)